MTTRSKRTFSIGPGVECDIDRLISTRLLVQANSGGGKSFTLRRLLEQTHGAVQQIVLDPEGEFSSLREQFDYVLAARQGGDTLADPRTAKLLAERLLELGVSAIVDIYELNPDARIKFVRLFLEALVDAPKNLWHPVLVVLDEAHVYCPEKEQAESSGAVKALCSRGRKRGFCAVLATQRLSKLAKDAAAECNNKLIGRTSLDVDMARAGDELGFTKGDRLVLRDLEDGEFFAFGPAMTKAVTRVKVGAVKTRHPEAGSKLAAVVPPPTDKVKALLPKLSDLPAEAEAREKTVADLKKDLATARRELTEARKAQPPAPKAVESKRVDVLKDADRALLEKLMDRIAGLSSALDLDVAKRIEDVRVKVASAVNVATSDMLTLLHRTEEEAEELLNRVGFQKILDKLAAVQPPQNTHAPIATGSRSIPAASQGRRVAPVGATNRPASLVSHEGISGPQQRILNALAWAESFGLPTQRREKVAFLADASPKSSAFMNNLGALRSGGLIDYPTQGYVGLTPAGRGLAHVEDNAPMTSAELQRAICAKLPGPQARIIDAVAKVYPEAIDRGAVADAANASPASSAFMNNLGALRSLGLIEYPNQGMVAAASLLFMEAR